MLVTGASKKPPTLHHTTRNGEMKTGHPTPRTKEKDRRVPAKQRWCQKQNNRAGDTRERERGPPQASRNTPDAAAAVRNVLRGLSPLGASLSDKLVERPSEARTKKKGADLWDTHRGDRSQQGWHLSVCVLGKESLGSGSGLAGRKGVELGQKIILAGTFFIFRERGLTINKAQLAGHEFAVCDGARSRAPKLAQRGAMLQALALDIILSPSRIRSGGPAVTLLVGPCFFAQETSGGLRYSPAKLG